MLTAEDIQEEFAYWRMVAKHKHKRRLNLLRSQKTLTEQERQEMAQLGWLVEFAEAASDADPHHS